MPWLIDGSNLARGGDREPVRPAALALARAERVTIVVFFDGAPPPGGGGESERGRDRAAAGSRARWLPAPRAVRPPQGRSVVRGPPAGTRWGSSPPARSRAGDGLRNHRVGARSLAIVGANILVIVAYTLVDGSGVRASGNAPSYIAWMFALTALTLVLARPWLGVRGMPQSHGAWGLLGVGAACTLGSYGIVLWAMTLAPIGLVAALRETSIVFGTVIATAWLRERVSAQRWAGVALIAAGGAAMKLA